MILKPLSPAARLLVCFGMTAPSVLVTVACLFTVQDLRRMDTALDWVRNALQVQNRIHRLVVDISEFEGGQRGYLFSGRRSHREAFCAAMARVPTDLAALGEDTRENRAQRERFLELQGLVMRRLDAARETVELKKLGQHDAAHALARSLLKQEGLERIQAIADKMREAEAVSLIGRDRALAERRQGHARWLNGLLVLNIATLVCTLFLLRRLEKAQSLARICAWSKRIEHEGQWLSFEEYLSCRFSIHSTHTISPAELERATAALPPRPRACRSEARLEMAASSST